MATGLKFVAYNGPSSRVKEQKTKTSLPASTTVVNGKEQTANPALELLLALEANESQPDIVAGQPPTSQDLEVHFSQCELEGSGPASPDELPASSDREVIDDLQLQALTPATPRSPCKECTSQCSVPKMMSFDVACLPAHSEVRLSITPWRATSPCGCVGATSLLFRPISIRKISLCV